MSSFASISESFIASISMEMTGPINEEHTKIYENLHRLEKVCKKLVFIKQVRFYYKIEWLNVHFCLGQISQAELQPLYGVIILHVGPVAITIISHALIFDKITDFYFIFRMRPFLMKALQLNPLKVLLSLLLLAITYRDKLSR